MGTGQPDWRRPPSSASQKKTYAKGGGASGGNGKGGCPFAAVEIIGVMMYRLIRYRSLTPRPA